MKTAVVLGALGVIGRYIVEKLAALEAWRVVGVSRRKGEDRERVRYIAVDLLDRAAAMRALGGLGEATHIFYAAFQPAPGAAADFARNVAANRDMLVNSVSALDQASGALERVVLVTGTKYYGSHLGAY